MASWPTTEEVKTYFTKLGASSMPEARVTRGRTKAIRKIQKKLRRRYDVSNWGTSSTTVPDDLVEIAYDLAYAFSCLAVHGGPQLSDSDKLALELLKQAFQELDDYAVGTDQLLDDAGQPIAQLSLSNGVQILEEPVMGMKHPLDRRVRQVGQQVGWPSGYRP